MPLSGKPCQRIDSSVSRAVFEEIQSALRARSLKLLYVAPERFANERFLAQLKTLRIDLLVIDEALSELIHAEASETELYRYLRQQLGTLQHEARALISQGVTSVAEVSRSIRSD